MSGPDHRPGALVTGAAQGIGAAMALALARAYHDIAVTSPRPATLAPVLGRIRGAGARGVPVALQWRDRSSIEAAFADAAAALGGFDVPVNNAGILLRRDAVDIGRDESDAAMDTHCTGTFFLSRETTRHLLVRSAPGCIVNLVSSHARVGMAQRSAYAVSKAAVAHMTRPLAVERASHGIRVNAVAPGRVLTESRTGSFAKPGYRASMLARIPLGRFGSVDEVADAVVCLAGPQAAYVTGHVLVMDAGVTVQ